MRFTKSCSLCLRTLDIRFFHSNSKSTDGCGSYCKKCTRAYHRYRNEQQHKLSGKTFIKRKKTIYYEVAPPLQNPMVLPEPVFEQSFV